MAKKKFSFKTWEVLLLALSGMVFTASATVYFSGISLRKYILGWGDEDQIEQMGEVEKKTGSLMRQTRNSPEFELISANSPLYDQDTLVTSSGSSATLRLEDGGLIELAPNSMVRLTFESGLSFGGINRAAGVQVVVGRVTGAARKNPIVLTTPNKQKINISSEQVQVVKVDAAPLVKPNVQNAPRMKSEAQPLFTPVTPEPKAAPIAMVQPSPSPSPSPTPAPPPTPEAVPPPPSSKIRVKFVLPKKDARFGVDKGSRKPEKLVVLEWKVSPPNTPLELIVKRIAKSEKEVLKKRVTSGPGGIGTEKVVLDQPGKYRWELRGMDGRPLAQREAYSDFSVMREFVGIEALSPLVGGQETNSNLYRGELMQNFDITFRWKSYPEASDYQVRVVNHLKDTKALLEKTVSKNEFSFNRSKVYSGRVFYLISAELPSGFKVISEPQPFIFNFLPPAPVEPQDKAMVSAESIQSQNNHLLMTWQKTNFTEGYELEIARDNKFANKILSRKFTENFVLLPAPAPGKYWWRIRSYSNSLYSPYSKAFEITIGK